MRQEIYFTNIWIYDYFSKRESLGISRKNCIPHVEDIKLFRVDLRLWYRVYFNTAPLEFPEIFHFFVFPQTPKNQLFSSNFWNSNNFLLTPLLKFLMASGYGSFLEKPIWAKQTFSQQLLIKLRNFLETFKNQTTSDKNKKTNHNKKFILGKAFRHIVSLYCIIAWWWHYVSKSLP